MHAETRSTRRNPKIDIQENSGDIVVTALRYYKGAGIGDARGGAEIRS